MCVNSICKCMRFNEVMSSMSPCSADFLSQAAEESWDRLRVTCTQPFNKHSQFGLSFLRIRTVEDKTEDSSAQQEDTVENLVRD